MSHLTRTTQESLFKTTVEPRPLPAVREDGVPASVMRSPRQNWAVAVDQTPEQMARTNESGWGDRQGRSVANLPPRKRGHHY